MNILGGSGQYSWDCSVDVLGRPACVHLLFQCKYWEGQAYVHGKFSEQNGEVSPVLKPRLRGRIGEVWLVVLGKMSGHIGEV